MSVRASHVPNVSAYLLPIFEPKQASERGIQLDNSYILIPANRAPPAPSYAISSDNWRKLALGLHAGPPHEDGLLEGCWAIGFG